MTVVRQKSCYAKLGMIIAANSKLTFAALGENVKRIHRFAIL